MTTEVKKPEEPEKERKSESGWTKTGVIFGVIGGVAAVLVFLLPQPVINVLHLFGGRSTPSATPSQNPTSEPPSGTMAPSERHLAQLPLAQGGGVVTVVGRDLSMPCGSGQSDDRYRQIEYELPGSYTSFTTHATVSGKADAEASVGVQVFIRARQEKSDRTLETGRAVVRASGSEPLTADITNARALLLRITCSASTLTVKFTDPQIRR